MKNKVINLFDNKKSNQNTGVKYSELLEQFVTPFIKEFSDLEYYDDMFEFAINAWNFGNLKVLMPPEDFEMAIDMIDELDVDADLLNRMIDHKVSKFKAFTNFIIDYDVKQTKADPILSVTTQSEEDHLHNMAIRLENEVTESDFEENYINRSAIIIKRQQPFFDWYANLYPDGDYEEELKETNVYLVDDSIDDLENWLKKKFDKFFMFELDEWHPNKKEWPQHRNFKMFNLWFHVEISKAIYDLEKQPVFKME